MKFTAGELTAGEFDFTIRQMQDCLLQGGNVGIGTTTPTEKLDVSGNILMAGNAVNRLLKWRRDDVSQTGGGLMAIALTSNGFSVMSNTAAAFDFTTANVNLVVAHDNVGIGTAAPATKLEVVGGHLRVDNSSTQIQFAKSGSQKWSVGSLDGTTDKFHIFEEAGAGSSGV